MLVRTVAAEQVLVRDQREDQRHHVGGEEDGRDRDGELLLALGRPAARLLIRGEVEHRRDDQADGGKAERGRRHPRGRAVERLLLELQPAGNHRSAEDEQDIADDRSGDRGLDDADQTVRQRYQSDDQLGGVTEGRVQQAANPWTGARGEMLGGPPHPAGQRDDREARDEEERRVVVPCRHEAHRHGHRNRDEQVIERPNLTERVTRLHQLILSEGSGR